MLRGMPGASEGAASPACIGEISAVASPVRPGRASPAFSASAAPISNAIASAARIQRPMRFMSAPPVVAFFSIIHDQAAFVNRLRGRIFPHQSESALRLRAGTSPYRPDLSTACAAELLRVGRNSQAICPAELLRAGEFVRRFRGRILPCRLRLGNGKRA